MRLTENAGNDKVNLSEIEMKIEVEDGSGRSDCSVRRRSLDGEAASSRMRLF